MNKQEVEQTFREVFSKWELHTDKAHFQVHELAGGWSLGYCGPFEGVPFTGRMHMAKDPPNYLSINLDTDTDICYLLFIQIERQHRGKGHGARLYDLVVELAGRLGCLEVRQTPSGGWGDRTREEYLVKRGWTMEEDEAVKSLRRKHDD